MSKTKLLSDLVKTDSPKHVYEEIQYILGRIASDFDTTLLKAAYSKVIDLYEGRFPGYQACNTEYHDLRHTTDTILAMARLIHGSVIKGHGFSNKQISSALIAALFHDAGYILETGDTEGTGAKYTADHVDRSVQFIFRLETEIGMGKGEITDCQSMILCTDLSTDIQNIHFSSQQIEILGKMLATADLYAQMADRTYLEKLKYLYTEFKEANIGDYESETDLLEKTVGFYEFIEMRVKNDLDSVNRFLYPHFKERWDVDEDLYNSAIVNQKNYLVKVLDNNGTSDISKHFKRRMISTKRMNKN